MLALVFVLATVAADVPSKAPAAQLAKSCFTVVSPSPQEPLCPDPILTPGKTANRPTQKEELAFLCHRYDSKAYHGPAMRLKPKVCEEYGIKDCTTRVQGPKGKPVPHYELDDLISGELGGANVEENFWPQSYVTDIWNAHTKDRLENYLHKQVCAPGSKLKLDQVQKELATDWIAAYWKYLGDPTKAK
jgi:hypothetical protein